MSTSEHPFRQLEYPTPPEHLSGRDLADKLATGMEHVHGWRMAMLAELAAAEAPRQVTSS